MELNPYSRRGPPGALANLYDHAPLWWHLLRPAWHYGRSKLAERFREEWHRRGRVKKFTNKGVRGFHTSTTLAPLEAPPTRYRVSTTTRAPKRSREPAHHSIRPYLRTGAPKKARVGFSYPDPSGGSKTSARFRLRFSKRKRRYRRKRR